MVVHLLGRAHGGSRDIEQANDLANQGGWYSRTGVLWSEAGRGPLICGNRAWSVRSSTKKIPESRNEPTMCFGINKSVSARRSKVRGNRVLNSEHLCALCSPSVLFVLKALNPRAHRGLTEGTEIPQPTSVTRHSGRSSTKDAQIEERTHRLLWNQQIVIGAGGPTAGIERPTWGRSPSSCLRIPIRRTGEECKIENFTNEAIRFLKTKKPNFGKAICF